MLFHKLGIIVILLCALPFNVYAGDTYKYKNVCPDPAGGNMWVDDWSFYKCECTSYVAFKLNEAGIPFRNHYKGVHWGYASNWKNAAESAGVPTYNSPKPGDVAWWSGHVAYVERVDYDSNGNWEKVWISEYNYRQPPGHDYGARNFTPQDSNKPTKYIRFRFLPTKEQLQVASFPGAENIAWYPRDKECDEAERWFELKDNGEVEDEIDQDSACSVVDQKRQEEADRIYQAKLQAQEEAYRQELEARKHRPWWQKVVDFIKDIFRINHTNAQEIDDELKNLVVYRTITIYTDNSGNIVDGDAGVRSGGDYYAGYYPSYTPNGNEATEHSQPGESDHPGYVHNVSMDDTEMSPAGSDDYHGNWTFYHGEVPTVNVRVRLKNKTNHKIGRNDVTIKWFESPNHTFNPQYDHHFATDHNRESIGPFKHNSHSDELVERKTGITYLQGLNPGVYYIYPIFYYEGEENMASEHDHNEYVKVTILPRYDVENVSFNSDKTTVTVGEGLTLSATVKNNYDSLPHDVRVGFYINGGSFNHKLFYAKVFTPQNLGTQSFTIPTLAPATPGSYTISMEVDDENQLAEKNENNNQRSFQLAVTAPLLPPTIDISGKWDITANGFYFQTFFFQEGNNLKGFMVYDGNQIPYRITGTVSGNQVDFFRDIGSNIPQEYKTTWSTNDNLSGGFSHNNQWIYSWSAIRAPDAGYQEDLSGTWAGTSNGYSFNMNITSSGAILKGTIHYDVLGMTEEINGFVDGRDIIFFRDNPQLINPQEFQGTFDGGFSLMGTFSHDGLWNYTWEANRNP